MLLPVLALSLLLEACSADPGKDTQPKRLYDFGLGKRAAYTYVSEYKRLPIYNFGLGKRSAYPLTGKNSANDLEMDYEDDTNELKDDYKRVKQYSFGLGKRLPVKQYSFGLGKRSDEIESEPPYLDTFDEEAKRSNGQRLKQYSFGLGKRLPMKTYSFGLGKRAPDDTEEAYMDNFNFDEETKRATNGNRFSFGLGKRDGGKQELPGRRSMQYNFGLGKRSQNDPNPINYSL